MVWNTIINGKSQTVPLRFFLRGGAVCTQATKPKNGSIDNESSVEAEEAKYTTSFLKWKSW